MSGKNCIDFGASTLEVLHCSDLGAGEAKGDSYADLCIVTSGDGKGTIVDRRGNTVSIDPSTSAEDKKAGTLKLLDPATGSLLTAGGLPALAVEATSKNQGKNVTSFELCSVGDPYKDLITYGNGKSAMIDPTAKPVAGGLTFLSPDGKSTRVVTGLGPEAISVNNAFQGIELGECGGGEKFLSRLALHASGSGTVLSWTIKDQDYFRSNIGGDTDIAFFCSDEKTGLAAVDGGPGTRLVVNLSPGRLNDVRYFVDTVLRSGVAAGSCGPLDAEKCKTAFEGLRSDYNSLSIQNPIDPLKTGGDTASDYLWKAAEIGGALILGILVFTIGGRGSECSNKVGGFSHPVELAKCLWRNPPPVGPVPVSPPVASPETHKIGLEAPVLLGAAVAVKAAPSLWAGAWETLSWLGQGSVDVAGGLLSGAARITIPIVIIPDDDPYFGNPAPGKYWGPQPSNQVWY